MQDLLKYTSYITGKRVIVDVKLLESGSLDYEYIADSEITGREMILLQEEARRQANAALNSKILLG
jgi:hypothetical protein